MRIIEDVSLSNFKAWSGAKSTLETLTSDQCDELESLLEDLYPDGMEDGELNDLLWFETDWIAELLGFRDWEDLENGGEEDEEEDEDE